MALGTTNLHVASSAADAMSQLVVPSGRLGMGVCLELELEPGRILLAMFQDEGEDFGK